MKGERIPTDAAPGLGHNPFAALSAAGLPAAPLVVPTPRAGPEAGARKEVAAPRNRGRVDIRRETGGRGGKTVTVINGFVGIGLPEKEQLAKRMRAACGCGGTVKDGEIVIQGDQREVIARILSEAGFRPVMAGG